MDQNLLLHRYNREKRARQAAEELMEKKSYELFLAHNNLHKHADQFAAQSEQLESILENAGVAILIADGGGAVMRFNQHSLELFPQDILSKGLSIIDLFAEEHQPTATHLVTCGSSSGESLDLKGVNHAGSLFPMEVTVSKISLHEEHHTIWICRDLSQREKAEARRRELEKELSQAQKMEALGTLASGIAHEINTPIQFVQDNIRFLQESFEDIVGLLGKYRQAVSVLEATQKEALLSGFNAADKEADLDFLKEELPECHEQSLEGIQRIGKIVSAIKEFSHPGNGEDVDIDVNEAIKTTSIVSHNQWKYVADLTTDLAPDLHPIKGNPGDFNQVVLNLIVNAAHAIEEKKSPELGAIHISTSATSTGLLLEISDTGCGIAEDHLKRIYDPFFTTKEVGKGTGQGLAITYNIISKKLGGTIHVETEEGTGTTFRLSIPTHARQGILS